jgi:hypothetical protein
MCVTANGVGVSHVAFHRHGPGAASLPIGVPRWSERTVPESRNAITTQQTRRKMQPIVRLHRGRAALQGNRLVSRPDQSHRQSLSHPRGIYVKKQLLLGLVAAIAAVSAVPALAQVRITEVAAWGSGNAPYASDWFELTNFGASAVSLSGWKMDDNSNSFGAGVSMSGITSIAAGESVIFLESSVNSAFLNTWFSSAMPGLKIGTYSGSGVGLSTSGDAVNVYNGSGVLQANVAFGTSPSGPTFASFNNAAGLNNTTISLLSAVGVNGAFKAANDQFEIGSPGSIAAPVPEPGTYAMLLAGLGLIGAVARKRRI